MEVKDLLPFLVALTALVFTIWQAFKTRYHNRLTLRPHLRIRFSVNANNDGKYLIVITNHGEGPAFVIHIKVFMNNKELTKGLFTTATSSTTLLKLFNNKIGTINNIGRLIKDDVISKGQTHNLLDVDIKGDPSEFVIDSVAFLKGLRVKVQYSSLYNEVFTESHDAIVSTQHAETNVESVRAVNTNLSYFIIREIIGWAGLLLPIFLLVIAWFYDSSSQYFYQPSISHYYYTVSGFLFIGLITLIGVFLISYRGYEPERGEISDNIITWIGGVLILVVAIVPTPFEWVDCYRPTPIAHNHTGLGWLHFASAAGFFLAMAYLSIKKFTKGNKPFTPDKIKRNKVYVFCGWGMLLVLGVAGIIIFFTDLANKWPHFIFWTEVNLLVLFGISWLVKGKGLVRLGIQKEDITITN